MRSRLQRACRLAVVPVASKMRAGYLSKNGVPYSDGAMVTEYFDRHAEQNGGDQWLTVTTIVDDENLTNSFVTSSHFKRQPDGSKWRPTPCAAQ